jgi:hypothetical protein
MIRVDIRDIMIRVDIRDIMIRVDIPQHQNINIIYNKNNKNNKKHVIVQPYSLGLYFYMVVKLIEDR